MKFAKPHVTQRKQKYIKQRTQTRVSKFQYQCIYKIYINILNVKSLGY